MIPLAGAYAVHEVRWDRADFFRSPLANGATFVAFELAMRAMA